MERRETRGVWDHVKDSNSRKNTEETLPGVVVT